LLTGTDRGTSAQFLLLALGLAGLALVVEALFWFASRLEIGTGVGGASALTLVAGGAVLGAAVNGYVNDGLLVSLLVGVAPVVGVAGFDALFAAPAQVPGLPSSALGATLAVGLVAAVAGVAGVLLGRLMKGDRRAGTRP
jgi:hypothetical protein